MSNPSYGDWRDVISPDLLERICDHLDTLLRRRAALQDQIDTLTAAGCVYGNIVEEYRGNNGPYYRLNYYVDPVTGIKPKPRYLGADRQKVEQVRQQIANNQTCQELRQQVDQIDRTFRLVQGQLDELQRHLAQTSAIYKQLSFA